MANPWLALWMQIARLGFEAHSVMTLRLLRLAAGGARARSEADRMVREKPAALAEAQTAAAVAAMTGAPGPKAAKAMLKAYKKRVRGNKRRLQRRSR